MGQSDRESLIEMGFPEDRVKLALIRTKHSGLQPALEWLTNPDNENEVLGEEAEGQSLDSLTGDNDDNGEGQTANSLKCNDCGKTFRGMPQAQFHAEKTGHDDFSESTETIAPLTEGEKAAKLDELRAKLAQKRALEAEKDKEEFKKNEAIRRKKDQDSASLIEDLQRKEQLKDIEKKKQEKAADAAAKARVKAEIEADRKARADRAAAAKALREGTTPPSASPAPAAAPAAPKASTANSARLQIRTEGSRKIPPITDTFPADTTLFEVASKIQEKTGVEPNSAVFMTTFPRKTYTGADLGATLKELGLVPSAALILKT
ncbi:hypothetical protein SAICODRAFT_80468 [Saitoella complicata NRRL Y-17804]|uniref:UBA domain-containing protein n=1 Tax=Saitoella complicata (strain BCRC 22490 / CBS 7301 / JCM 7358 / NBRC 10748 / NRRL Y-17804) TaxID=698492 RepID=A0A0E9NI18_SAICN|nr:uncharacterized protein SAICODRAFT_80468 [Saitoella complicata NRRL Y-17804]ODQ52978.1 hypothetical protein SAICODRAFT_80468 [Saitoella complicata NRRL Y-17804]GAO49055.1 hypothetical protein G7K_3216-t1 [Saitoella complicata NRRL Y-17804]